MSTSNATLGAILPRRHRMTLTRKASVIRWVTVVVFVGLWEFIWQVPLGGNDYVAPPSQVLTTGIAAVFRPDNLAALWTTTSRFLEAFAITAAAGIPIGLGLGRLHRQIFHGARDVVAVFYALPMVPFYPLFVLWLGLGMRSEVAFGVIHGIMPVILITMSASAAVDQTLIASGVAMGATARQRVGSIVMPSVVPDIVSALKIGASLSLLGVLLAQLMISVDGVGTFILNQITNHQAAALNAMVLVICVGVVAINAGLAWVERRLSFWRG